MRRADRFDHLTEQHREVVLEFGHRRAVGRRGPGNGDRCEPQRAIHVAGGKVTGVRLTS